MLITVAITLAILIGAFLLFAATRPNSFRVERSVAVQAPPEQIFPLINDFHNWREWSPYEKLDPAMKKTFTGAPSGPGAVYQWAGNSKAGEGRMEIVDAKPVSQVTIDLSFLKPFPAHNTAQFTLAPRGGATHVTWAVFGPNTFLGKIMCAFISMDKMLGKDFSAGLANIKTISEHQSQ
ncbi:MAG: SRPBCC family protein [Candidatus Solibacter sp.]